MKAVGHVLTHLPADFPVPILLLQHLGQQSSLVEILQGRCALSLQWARSGQLLRASSVYVAPPACVLSAEVDATISLTPMASARHFPLAADQLLASMAYSYRHRALALVLSGTGRGGSHGVQEVKQQGGRVFAQDEASSLYWDMPKAAIETGCVDAVLPLQEIAPALVSTVMKDAYWHKFGERSQVQSSFSEQRNCNAQD